MALSKGHTFTSGEVVTPTKLNNLVDNATIGDGTITTAMIADDAITADQIADDAITSDKIADDAITSDKIVDDAITSDKIADGSVTSSHLASGAGGGVTSVTAGNGLDGGEITSSGTIAIPTSGGTLNINSGKVGIGLDSDTDYALKVAAKMCVYGSGSDGTELRVEDPSATSKVYLKGATSAVLDLQDEGTTSGSQRFRIQSNNGNLKFLQLNDDASSTTNTLMQLKAGGKITLDSLPTSDPSVTGELWNDGGVVRVSGSSGVTLSTLPTTDPSVAGQLWNDGGVVSVSGSSGYSGAGDTFTLGTKQTYTTTGAASDAEFTGIPSGVKQVNIMVSNIKQNHTAESALTMQIGDSGGYETSGYVVRPTTSMNMSNIGTRWELAAAISSSDTGIHGIATMYRIDDYTWVYSSGMCRGNTTVGLSGSKTLSGTLDRIKFIFDYTVNSTSDPGYINISYI